jgi:hypothetical protein
MPLGGRKSGQQAGFPHGVPGRSSTRDSVAHVCRVAAEIFIGSGAVETVMTDLCDTVLAHSTGARLVVGDRRHGVVHQLQAGSVGHRVCTMHGAP